MAGRGRGMTLPAWMTEQAQPQAQQPPTGNGYAAPGYGFGYGYGSSAQVPPQPQAAYAEAAAVPRERDSDRKSDRESRSRDEKRRSKSRSRSRHRSRNRSRSRSRSRSESRSRRKSSRGRDDSRSRSRSKRSSSASGYRSRRRNRKSNFDVRPSDVGGAPVPFMAPQPPRGGGGGGSGGGPYGVTYTAPPPAHPHQQHTTYGPPPAGPVSSSLQQTRHARRLYVGGIGHDANEVTITNFFNDVISRALHKPGENPVMTVYINRERNFAFVELNTIELTTACLQLDGIKFNGQSLRVRRPNDYNPSVVPPPGPIPSLDLSFLGVVSTTVPDGPNKVFVGGLPYTLSEDQVKELLSSFGALRAFHLVRDAGSSLSKGYGFCEYMDPSVTKLACEGLNGLTIGDKTLTVRVADPKGPPSATGGGGAASYGVPAGVPGHYGTVTFDMKAPTRVLVLSDMVTREELQDDREYADILDDVRYEMEQHGRVISVTIPREKDGYAGAAIGRIFVEYADPAQARIAGIALSSKKFGDKVVQADYYSEESYAAKRLGE